MAAQMCTFESLSNPILKSCFFPSLYPSPNCISSRPNSSFKHFSSKKVLRFHARILAVSLHTDNNLPIPKSESNKNSPEFNQKCQKFIFGMAAATSIILSLSNNANALSSNSLPSSTTELTFHSSTHELQNIQSLLPSAFSIPHNHVEKVPNSIQLLSSDTVSSNLDSESTAVSDSSCNISINGMESSNEGKDEKVSDLALVKEAWEVVRDSFYDARNNKWNEEDWEETLKRIEKNPPHSKKEAYSMISTMVAKLKDPFSRFIVPDQFAQLAKYDITGIGLNISEVIEDKNDNNNNNNNNNDNSSSNNNSNNEVQMDDQVSIKVKVIGIILDSPAYSAGIRQGDEIVSVNEMSVDGLSSFEVSSLIQGPKGSKIELKVKNACGDVKDFSLTRNSDAPTTPVYFRLEKNNPNFEKFAKNGDVFGYVKLKEFNSLAKKDLVTAINKLENQGANSFILDLRDNPGGLVQAGVEISRMFLDEGSTIISIEGRNNSSKRSIVSDGNKITDAPLIVLVNDRTASASEIVSAALHDNCRAVLIGKKTYGKGLIQSVYELSDGSGLIITVGKYVTPSLKNIDRNGIAPDFTRFPDRESLDRKMASCEAPSTNSSFVFETANTN